MSQNKTHYTFREQRRNQQLGGHIYEEKWECPIFSGGTPEEFITFWMEFYQIYIQAEWDEDMIYEKICSVLKGLPLRLVRNIPPQDQQATNVARVLIEAFAPEGNKWEFRRRIEEDYLHPREQLQNYRARQEENVLYYNQLKAFHGGSQMTAQDAYHYFIKGLPKYFQQKLIEHPVEFNSINQAWPYLTRLATVYNGFRKPETSSFKWQQQTHDHRKRSPPGRTMDNSRHKDKYENKKPSNPQKKFCTYCKKKGHDIQECYKRQNKKKRITPKPY